jgi:F0F1-type ATP synthase delta subunit
VAPEQPAVLRLPVQILSGGDVSRLSREVESLGTFFEQAAVRGTTAQSVPQVSQLLTALLNENNINVLLEADRKRLSAFLKTLHEKAPVVHISFATDPRPDFLMKIAAWFRAEAHPHVLLKVGLQPTIAAGCVIRTTNKYFDFSFKRHFQDSKAKLGAALQASE